MSGVDLSPIGVEDVADLELLQGLLYLALLSQDQPLHVVGVLSHRVRLLELLLDNDFTFLNTVYRQGSEYKSQTWYSFLT